MRRERRAWRLLPRAIWTPAYVMLAASVARAQEPIGSGGEGEAAASSGIGSMAVSQGDGGEAHPALGLVEMLRESPLGAWLEAHPVAWNAAAIGVVLLAAGVLFVVLRIALAGVLTRALLKSGRKRLADALEGARVVPAVALMVPLLLAARIVGALGEAGAVQSLVAFNASNLMVALAIMRGIGLASGLMRAADEVYSSRPEVNRPEALRGYRQVAMVVIGIAGGISAAAVAVGKSPLVFLAAIGAVGAVLGVVFKDVLVSLVANLQLTASDALRVGDWVELRAHAIDGRIAEIKTTSVRVQNADGTMHAVPISRFVQEPYMNYRSKYGSPGRRVRRSLRVDVRSVRAVTPDEIAALERLPALAGVVERARRAAGDAPLTNLCIYRAFAERALAANPAVDATLPVVVSQQEASPTGLPVDVLCFIRPATAPDLAAVEGALLDRLTLGMPCFALRAYQQAIDLGPANGPLPWLAQADLSAAGV